MRVRAAAVLWLLVLMCNGLNAQSSNTARQVVDTMLVHEGNPGEHRNRYMYVSEERSNRTGGHLWQERVVETAAGKVRLLIAVDGQPLSAERAAAERARLADIAAHPDAFAMHDPRNEN